jgi:hypothetical protein
MAPLLESVEGVHADRIAGGHPILAILAAMLLPALGKAKAKAQGIQCLGNLRQLSLARFMYASLSYDGTTLYVVPPAKPL